MNATPIKRKYFQEEDDKQLIELVNRYGKNWKEIGKQFPPWTERQLRDRYYNYLQPGLNHSKWTPYEDNMLLISVTQVGPKWSYLTKLFMNRSSVNIKNRYSFLTGSAAKKMRKLRAANLQKKINENKISQNDSNSSIQFDILQENKN